MENISTEIMKKNHPETKSRPELNEEIQLSLIAQWHVSYFVMVIHNQIMLFFLWCSGHFAVVILSPAAFLHRELFLSEAQ